MKESGDHALTRRRPAGRLGTHRARTEQALSEAMRLARATQRVRILIQSDAPPPRHPTTYVPAELLPKATYEIFEAETASYLLGVSQSGSVAARHSDETADQTKFRE